MKGVDVKKGNNTYVAPADVLNSKYRKKEVVHITGSRSGTSEVAGR